MADQEAPAAAGKVSFNVSATVRYPVTATEGLAVAKARTAEAREAHEAEMDRLRAEGAKIQEAARIDLNAVIATIAVILEDGLGKHFQVTPVEGAGLEVRDKSTGRRYNVDVREGF